jgi:hypothetical protein
LDLTVGRRYQRDPRRAAICDLNLHRLDASLGVGCRRRPRGQRAAGVSMLVQVPNNSKRLPRHRPRCG